MSIKKRSVRRVVSHSLKDLKKAITQKKAQHAEPVSKRAVPHMSKEDEFFIKAMKEVEEIKEFRKIPVILKKNCESVTGSQKDAESRIALRNLEEIIEGKKPIPLADTQEYVKWVHKDYGDDVARKLHDGVYSVQDSLDIHGFVAAEAEAAVEHFIRVSRRKGHHCVKIITGRGLRSPKGPVLKDAVIFWLSRRFKKHVIAFVSARQCDGGLGAIYVLLR